MITPVKSHHSSLSNMVKSCLLKKKERKKKWRAHTHTHSYINTLLKEKIHLGEKQEFKWQRETAHGVIISKSL